MNLVYCQQKCCQIQLSYSSRQFEKHHTNQKAGIVVYDRQQDRVLLVQSHLHFWGPPKGTLNKDEAPFECALRELKEETGLELNIFDLEKAYIINNSIYYYTEKPFIQLKLIPTTDVDGLTWIKIDCLAALIETGQIILSKRAWIVLNHFLDKKLPQTEFKTVRTKKFSIR